MKINDRNHKLETTYVKEEIIENISKINNNEDWKNLDIEKNYIIDINNSDYFGIRAFEKGILAVIYSPIWISNLKKILKESKRFNTTQFITFDLLEFDPLNKNKSSSTTEWFLKEIAKIVSEIEEIKDNNLVLNIVDNKQINLDKVIITLSTIYKYKIAITTSNIIKNNYINFIIKK